MLPIVLIGTFFAFFLSANHGLATEIFRFVDEAGGAHFSDTPMDLRYRPFTEYGAPKKKLQKKPQRGRFDDLIKTAADGYGVDHALVKAVVRVESDFNDQAISPAGAMGLMQLMPKTASDLGVTDPFNPEQNVRGGTRYLRSLLDILHNDLKLALAAYNAGLQRVLRHGAIPPIRETERYVEKVLHFYRIYSI
jgi:soluble lytic murein transglycosylase-like protein